MKQEQWTTELERWSKGQSTGKGEAMSDVTLATELIREAYPTTRHGNAKGAIWAAYRGLKLRTVRRARSIYNGEAKRIDAHEMDALRRAALKELQDARYRALERIEQIQSLAAGAHDPGA